MNDKPEVVVALAGLLVILIGLGIWVSLIVFGVKAAKKKNRSPHWMWFGLHPVGALVVFIVMMCLSPAKLCPQCARRSPPGARICPFCAYSFAPVTPPGTPPAA